MYRIDVLYPPIAHTNHGTFQGSNITAPHGTTYFSFQGIRYAKPPLKRLRFKDPQPFPGYGGTYVAAKEGNACAQSDPVIQQKMFFGNEDCLYLNVYTPYLPSTDSESQIFLPVMVWIHGGGFFAGSGSIGPFGPDHLVQNNVVIVTLNYRLGILGFLCLENAEVPGNAGLKDIVMALRWVRDNISSFGGDPQNVTIFGESAGGSAVQYLMVSEMAKGLFHKAISQSGSCLNQWAYTTKNSQNPTKNATEISKLVGLDYTDPDELLNFLWSLSAEDIVKLSHKTLTFEDKRRDAAFTFAPVVEKEYLNVEPFITRSPMELMKSGKINNVPYMTGYNSREAIYWMINIKNDRNYLSEYNRNFQYFVPLEFGFPMNSKKSKEVASKIRKFYFKELEVNETTIENFIDLMTDTAFLREIVLSTEIIQQHIHPVFMYRFSFDGEFNLFKKKFNINIPGTSHEDDLGYIFNPDIFGIDRECCSISSLVRNRMVRLWTNFAKFGNPTPEMTELLPVKWIPVSETLQYLEINADLRMKINPEAERIKFWKKLYLEYKK